MSDPFDALRRDVSYLGRVLGDTLVEQEGPGLFELEEQIRALAKARRAGGRDAREASRKLTATVRAMDTRMAERVVDGTWDIRSLGFGLEFVSRPHLKGRIALAAPTWKLFPM